VAGQLSAELPEEGPMTESSRPANADAGDLSSTPSGKAAGGEGEDLHGVAREVHEDNQEGGADEAAKTPGG
jgi:hypothetical protein